MKEVKNIDIKGTFEKFIKEDEPEMSQEEAINNYQEEEIKRTIKNSSNNGENGEGMNSEEQEHLKRVKQELLASLERVKKIEKQIYGEKEEHKKEKLNVESKQKYIAKDTIDKRKTEIREVEQKERE